MDWGSIIIAALTVLASTGFATLIVYLIEIRPRRRQAEATADQAEAAVRKTDAEAKRTSAEADNLTLKGAFDLIEVLTGQVKYQEQEQAQLKTRVERLEGRCVRYLQRIEHLLEVIRRLVAQIRDLGAEPCVEPDTWDPEECEGC